MIKHTLLAAAVATLLGACSGEPEAPKAPMIRNEGEVLVVSETDKLGVLKLATVTADEGGQRLLPGRLVWDEDRTVRVYPQLGGRVRNFTVDVGNSVKSGQTLAVLFSPDYGQARADAKKAEADLQVAKAALARNRELREAGIVAEKDWQQSEADFRRAQAEAERAASRLQQLGGDGDGNYALKSPLAGVVVERNLNPGMEFRTEGDTPPLFVVTDPSHLWLQLDAGEADLRYLKVGDRVTVQVKQYPGETFPAVIARIADYVDPASRTVKIRCTLDNPDRRLKGEMFAQAAVALPPSEALRVPAGAVMLLGERNFVLVEETPGRYRRQAVEAGDTRDGLTEVRGGLNAGERVVAEGNLNLLRYFPPLADKRP